MFFLGANGQLDVLQSGIHHLSYLFAHSQPMAIPENTSSNVDNLTRRPTTKVFSSYRAEEFDVSHIVAYIKALKGDASHRKKIYMLVPRHNGVSNCFVQGVKMISDGRTQMCNEERGESQTSAKRVQISM